MLKLDNLYKKTQKLYVKHKKNLSLKDAKETKNKNL